jgi:hypothetical protein
MMNKWTRLLLVPATVAMFGGAAYAQSSVGSGSNPATPSTSGPSVKPGTAPIGQMRPSGSLNDPNCVSSQNGNCVSGNVNNDHAGDSGSGRTDRPQTEKSKQDSRTGDTSVH